MSYPTPPEARRKIDERHAIIREMWLPPLQMTVSEWADRYRIMPSGTSPRPGKWVTESYQREIMDVFDDPRIHVIVAVKCTQVGWSEILNNVAGKHIHLDPKPMMLVQPSLENAKDYGKKRLTPMIDNCPELASRVTKPVSRKPGNTLLLKEFLGGFLKLTGANSGKGLRSDPLPIVLYDEADAYPDDVDGEGSPLDIGENRTEGFDDFKMLIGSTPAKPKGLSQVEEKFERSDQRRFHVPCPHCGFEQALWWRDPETEVYRLVYELDENDEVIADSVAYICAGCSGRIEEKWKTQMLAKGRWVPKFPGRAIVGFHINALYRPWKKNWASMAQKWANAQGDHEKLKDFITLQLAEFWEEKGQAQKPGDLQSRREHYPVSAPAPENHARPWEFEVVPSRAAVLTCVADVQENRIEAKIKAWGVGEESWLIAHEVFWGDPSADPSVWESLDKFRLSEFTHAGGRKVRAILTLIDSGDQTDAVYDYVMPRQNLRDCVFASKGVDYLTKPVLVAEGTTKRAAVRLFTIATNPAKDRIFSRMKLAGDGPGRMHWPMWTTEEYFKQLASEKKVVTRNKKTRVKKTTYVKTHTRNEALDLEVMSLAALWILQNVLDPSRFRDLDVIARALAGDVREVQPRGRRVRSHGEAA
jgi:phage terminase large subunit GpA-like protein